MKKLLVSGLALAGVLALSPDLSAHGGQYRGPGDVVPPNPGGGRGSGPGAGGPATPGPAGPNTPGPSGPATPGPAGPATGGPAPAAGPAATSTGPRGAVVEPDLTRWAFWWEFNKDPFINLREAIHTGNVTTGSDDFFMGGARRGESRDTLKPSESQILGEVLPALKQALDATDDRDITSSCMVAMAKIGRDHSTFRILPLFEERLKSSDQEIRETAALAIGISAMPEGMPTLISLLEDSEAARTLSSRGSIDDRTRTFAAYGIGLTAWANSNPDLKRTAFEALKKVLANHEKESDRNIKVGVINALRLLRPGEDTKLRDDVIDALWSYYSLDLGQGEQAIQAHVPTALATLLGRDGDTTGKYRAHFAGELDNKFGKRNNSIYQSCALALGSMLSDTKADKPHVATLAEYAGKGRDHQARFFSIMALGMIGGNDNKNELLKRLEKGRDIEKSWAAIALGVYSFNEAEAAGKSAVVDSTVGRAIHRVLMNEKNDDIQSACSVALGLCKYQDAADDLRKLLEKYKKRDEFAGYLCIGLALMNDARSTELIREIVNTSVRRPDLLKQAAIALGKMGDKRVAEDLTKLLSDPDKNVAKLSAIASALGFIGDRRSIGPLKSMLFDQSITPLSRAFAAVALGGVADKELLPWNSKIAVNLNYRAAVETLTNQVSGILDIL